MLRSRRTALALLTAATLVGSAMTASSAFAGTEVPDLTTSVVPSTPTDPTLHEVAPGSAPWVIKSSVVQLNEGLLAVRLRGLVIPGLGTPGPVTSVDAALYCGNETKAAFTTKTFPLSEAGDALIVERVKLPPNCLTPAVLINPLGIGSIYIATDGFPTNQLEALFASSLQPSVPTDPTLHGVEAGSAPWVLNNSVAVHAGGFLAVTIRGLIIPGLGTPGPVTSVDAALYCGNETTPAITTKTFPLSEAGNALILERVKLPSNCLTPALLINPLGIGSIYIATSGFSG
jgi:hypothetical protein